mmetsp:Transcript_40613/g.44075  ORF Transcript_40613/g.44075 Transcript_40613/m.44075 type:complete len:465 (+) Transcript_40613:179-1573(+)
MNCCQVQRAKKRSSDLSSVKNKDSSPQESTSCLISRRSAPILYAATYLFCQVLVELTIEGTQNAFPDLLALPYAMTLFQFSCCFLLPICISKGETIKKIPRSLIKIFPYIVLSLVVFSSNVCKSSSARYVSFPTKVIFKSTKLMPTMLVATIFQNKKYGRLNYLAAALLCIGAAGYSIGETTKNDEKMDSYYGIFLLIISVLCDAITPNIKQWLMMNPIEKSNNPQIPQPPLLQSSLSLSSLTVNNNPKEPISRQGIQPSTSASSLSSVTQPQPDGFSTSTISSTVVNKTTSFRKIPLLLNRGRQGLNATTLMTNAYAVGCIGLLAFMTGTGHLDDVLKESVQSQYLFANLTFIGTLMSVAVFAHTRLIKESGAVTAVAVTTLRDFATVLLSYIVYPKIFSTVHAISAILVFGGILLSFYTEYSNNSTTSERAIGIENKNRGSSVVSISPVKRVALDKIEIVKS